MGTKKDVFTILAFLLVMLGSCSRNPVSPRLQPGPRDYTWTLDTLKDGPLNVLTGIWGSSPTDVWVVGPSGTINDMLWHYDGKSWIPWFPYHKQTWACVPAAIYGFSANDIWMGGNRGGRARSWATGTVLSGAAISIMTPSLTALALSVSRVSGVRVLTTCMPAA